MSNPSTPKIDKIIENIFKLSMEEFFILMQKIQEKMSEHQQNMESFKFK